MEIENKSPYLPKSGLKSFFSSFKARIAYRIWRKKLKKYGGFNISSDFKLLEVGCGPGYFLRCIEKWFPKAQIFGGDIDNDLLRFAKKYAKRAILCQFDAHQFPFQDNSFDSVIALQVIEHLKKPEEFLKEAKRCLKKNGLLLLATPNPNGVVAKVLGKKWQGHRYDHLSLRSPQQWREALRNSGFKVLEDGTTAFSGFKILQKLPFALINWVPLAIFGFFHWYKGESYMAIVKKI